MRNWFSLLIVALVISIFANGYMYQRFRNRRVVMTINGHAITQQDVYDYLSQNSGPNVRFLLVQRFLWDDAAQKQKLLPTDAEIQEAFNEERERNMAFAREIAVLPWKEAEYKAQIRQNMEIRRLLTANVAVSEDQIKEEYEAQPAAFDTPAKARTQLALIKNVADLDKIRELMEKKVNPSLIQTNFPESVVFVGDNNVFTFFQHLGTKENEAIFKMKKGEVQMLPPDVFAQSGAQKLIVRMLDDPALGENPLPGKKASLTDPKTHEKIRQQVALKRAQPPMQYLNKLWADADFKSEDPTDKPNIERVLHPDIKAAAK